MFAVINLSDTFEQRFIERYLVIETCKHRLHLFLDVANLISLFCFDQSKEHTRHTVKCLPALLESEDSILEGCRVFVLHNLCDFITFLLNGSLKGGQIVRGLNLTEVRSTKWQRALLQQRVITIIFRTACQLHRRYRQHRCRDSKGYQFLIHHSTIWPIQIGLFDRLF